ncbi:hypothetical protein CHS0354_010402 [Potamilus streckersoni]|uniref:Uncharacterized protein n=1 Tax=Potamilus streckersoni TaxID=2493646 RepID=A0AAE0W799_9BIVA|nr:hypothetical protein CHS0354_010402 [Potamilus streckersoni]
MESHPCSGTSHFCHIAKRMTWSFRGGSHKNENTPHCDCWKDGQLPNGFLDDNWFSMRKFILCAHYKILRSCIQTVSMKVIMFAGTDSFSFLVFTSKDKSAIHT